MNPYSFKAWALAASARAASVKISGALDVDQPAKSSGSKCAGTETLTEALAGGGAGFGVATCALRKPQPAVAAAEKSKLPIQRIQSLRNSRVHGPAWDCRTLRTPLPSVGHWRERKGSEDRALTV